MRIFQIAATVTAALREEIVAISRCLRGIGYENSVYIEQMSGKFREELSLVKNMPKLRVDDVVLLHITNGKAVQYPVDALPCRLILMFHGFAMPRYFREYSNEAVSDAEQGMDLLCRLSNIVQYAFVDTDAQKDMLKELNYSCPMTVRPISVPLQQFNGMPDMQVMEAYENSGKQWILWNGRITPNHNIEDVLQMFCCYQRQCNSESGLLLLGSSLDMERYQQRLQKYTKALELQDVVFVESPTAEQEIAYYRRANAFVTLAEQPEDLTPIAEAIYFNLPILAYEKGGSRSILGDGGIQVSEKNPMEEALLLHKMLSDPSLRRNVVAEQQVQRQNFNQTIFRSRMGELLEDALQTLPLPEKKRFGRR